MEAKHVRSWLRALVPLAVIMGLTWIFGVLIVEVEALIPLAYIYTILVAFQGVFIFLLFVLFDSKVREDVTQMWRSKVKESDLLSGFFASKTSSTQVVSGLGLP
jgi:apolipoprotein N-acyltransferase